MNTNYDDARAMLRYVAPADHETRYRVGMALYDGFGEHGWSLFDEWLATHDNYRRELRSWGRSHWRGLGRSGGGRGVSMGTLVHLAKAGGWQGDYRAQPVNRAAQQQRRRDAAQQRKQSAEQAQARAAKLIEQAALEHHPYLDAKGFQTEFGLVSGDLLLIPIRNIAWAPGGKSGPLLSLQTIKPDGTKRYLLGSNLSGGGHRLGSVQARDIFYVEGYATALSVREALRQLPGPTWAVVACMSAHGLESAGKRHPRRRRGFVIADHDDWLCTAQPGTPHRFQVPVAQRPKQCAVCGDAEHLRVPAGEKAARSTGLPWTAPAERGDANDLHQAEGVEAVRQMIRSLRLAV